MTLPASVPTDGNLKVAWAPAIADPSAPTVAELTAGTVIDLSCYLTVGGYTPATSEQTSTDDRLCSENTFEQPGKTTNSLDVMYVYQPQDPTAADNKAKATLTRLAAGYIVERWGAPYGTAFAAGDVVDVKPAKCGAQVKQAPESNSQFKIGQKIFITGDVKSDVAVVA